MLSLFVKVRDVIRDMILMGYIVWMIKSEDLRSRIEDKVMKMDMNIKDREGK